MIHSQDVLELKISTAEQGLLSVLQLELDHVVLSNLLLDAVRHLSENFSFLRRVC